MTRYWRKEFKNRGPDRLEEVFNFHHSKLRNVVERSFGVAKNKWQMLKGVSHYPTDKQRRIIMACFALHNFVMDENAVTPTVHMVPQAAVRQLSDQWVQSNAENDVYASELDYKWTYLHGIQRGTMICDGGICWLSPLTFVMLQTSRSM